MKSTATTTTDDKVRDYIFDVLDDSFHSDQRSLSISSSLFFSLSFSFQQIDWSRATGDLLGDIIDDINRTIAIAACYQVYTCMESI